jgi:hypothetical protein
VQLQGSDLSLAQLQGANLFDAQLQGVNLYFAGLQGADLQLAKLNGVLLDGAFLWRARLKKSLLENISIPATKIHWGPMTGGGYPPKPWTDATYALLRQSVEREVPEGALRDQALNRVAILDCG